MKSKNNFHALRINIIKLLTQSGSFLIIATLLALLIANSIFGLNVIQFIIQPLNVNQNHFSIHDIVNNGLMTFFFLIIAIELKQEFLFGELASFKKALLPAMAAIGGMIVPAIIYIVFTYNTPHVSNWPITMATDIAFALAIFKIVGQKFPKYLRVLLMALAVFDDFGSIIVIAIVYSSKIQWMYVLIILLLLLIFYLLNKFKITYTSVYVILFALLWYVTLSFGIHPTMAGVMLGFILPTRIGEQWFLKLEHWVYFLIVPLFAFVNMLIPINITLLSNLNFNIIYGICFGLLLGKPLGILLGVYLIKFIKPSSLPPKITFYNVLSIGIVASIGFTVSLFVADLSFKTNLLALSNAKIAIIISGLITVVSVKILQWIELAKHEHY